MQIAIIVKFVYTLVVVFLNIVLSEYGLIVN